MSFKKERIDIEIIEHVENYCKVKIGTTEVWIQEPDLEIAKKEVLKDEKAEKAHREEMSRKRDQLYTWNEVEAATRKALDDHQNGW